MRTNAILASLALVSSLVAQDPAAISPQGAGSPTQLGNTNNNIPFSWTPTSYQQIHDANSFTSSGVQLWTKMRQRMASGFTNRAGQTIDVELILGTASVSAATASTVFAANVVSTTETTVFTRKQILLPTIPDNSWAIAPYVFDVPYVWTGSNLSLRANVYGNTNNNQIFTYPLDAWSGTTPGAAVANGAFGGCKHPSGTTNASHSATIAAPGGNAIFNGDAGYAKSMPAFLLLGASNSTWGSIPLPFDMTAIGAPGCSIVNDPLFVVNGLTDAGGLTSWTVGIPANPGLEGQQFFSQIAFVDAAANGLGGYMSNGQRDIIGGALGITRIWATINSTSGSIGTRYGMAVGFN